MKTTNIILVIIMNLALLTPTVLVATGYYNYHSTGELLFCLMLLLINLFFDIKILQVVMQSSRERDQIANMTYEDIDYNSKLI